MGRGETRAVRSPAAFRVLMIVLVVALVVSMVATSCLGAIAVSLPDAFAILVNRLFGVPLPADGSITTATQNVIWQLRFPRILLGVAVGAGLALAGVVMQASVQNTLAEPYILGISSGATFGATFAIMLGAGSIGLAGVSSVPLFSFLGSIVATVGVLLLASAGGKMTASKLVLSGMILNALFTALSNFIVTVAADAEGMLDLKFWTMGSLTRAGWDNVGYVLLVVLVAVAFFLTQFRSLNVLLMGDEAATTLGLHTARRRWVYLIVSALLVGCLVAAVGTIGFVGLMIPHIARSLVGSDHRRLIPAAVLIGAIFMLWADAAARTLMPNSEVPIGILTAVIGAPFFVYIMVARNYSFKGN